MGLGAGWENDDRGLGGEAEIAGSLLGKKLYPRPLISVG